MAKEKNTAIRLTEYMETTGLKQVDILRRAEKYCREYGVKLSKSDLSQYCNGKNEPSQDKLYILSLAMNVSVAWLMGYDVPMGVAPLSETDMAREQGRITGLELMENRDRNAVNMYLELSEKDKDVVKNMIERLHTWNNKIN